MANKMTIEKKESFPKGENVFHHDAYHMGVSIHGGLIALYSNGKEEIDYLILADQKTGMRYKVTIERE